ncbi:MULTISPECIES: Fur family transcriptional regulator [unclassified Exiguobacterium]|uniref:Fur family transcriptional regulator n=1 Tax=unclassified Exiguobacterium TaxID=2644629 RepID=UPI001BECAB52|nr:MULTISPECIES: Fur family transcriptional regulator [unclassified Exiguobacterium]
MKTNIEQARERMKASGFKMTPKRLDLLSYLFEVNRYVSAREVAEALRMSHPSLSYDTIYRNLNDFSEIDLLEVTELDGEMKYRAACASGHHHHHLICRICGKTETLNVCPMEWISPAQETGFEVEDHKFEIYGRCANCQRLTS